jgi:hypothetical protein
MIWIILYAELAEFICNIEIRDLIWQDRIDREGIDPYCRNCDIPEGMDW